MVDSYHSPRAFEIAKEFRSFILNRVRARRTVNPAVLTTLVVAVRRSDCGDRRVAWRDTERIGPWH